MEMFLFCFNLILSSGLFFSKARDFFFFLFRFSFPFLKTVIKCLSASKKNDTTSGKVNDG